MSTYSREDAIALARNTGNLALATALATQGNSLPPRVAPAAALVVGVSIRIPDFRLTNSLNVRENRWDRSKRAKREKCTVGHYLLAAGRPSVLPPCTVTLTRIYTGRAQAMDEGCGLNASFKAVRDEVARWLGTNDSPKSGIKWEYEQVQGDENAVVISLAAAPAAKDTK